MTESAMPALNLLLYASYSPLIICMVYCCLHIVVAHNSSFPVKDVSSQSHRCTAIRVTTARFCECLSIDNPLNTLRLDLKLLIKRCLLS
jgi:hypothetical protein